MDRDIIKPAATPIDTETDYHVIDEVPEPIQGPDLLPASRLRFDWSTPLDIDWAED